MFLKAVSHVMSVKATAELLCIDTTEFCSLKPCHWFILIGQGSGKQQSLDS